MLQPGDSEGQMINGARMGVGYVDTGMDYAWQNAAVPMPPDTVAFVTTDGLIDQIGGPREISFGKRRMREGHLRQRARHRRRRSAGGAQVRRAWQGQHRRRDDPDLLLLPRPITPRQPLTAPTGRTTHERRTID